MKLIQWLDRNWNILFHRQKCLKITLAIPPNYNDYYFSLEDDYVRYMGNGWFKIQNDDSTGLMTLKKRWGNE